MQSKQCSSVSSSDQQRKATPTVFLGFEMKIKTILEIAFPHCVVRSFHYVRVSLPTSGAGVIKPRDGACMLGGGLPWAWVPPSLRWAASSAPAWPGAVGPHTMCPRPSRHHGTATQAWGHFVGRIVFIRWSCVMRCSRSWWPRGLGMRKVQTLRMITTVS